MIKIILPGNPIPWKAPYVGKRGAFNPRMSVLNKYRMRVKDQYEGCPFVDPVICDVKAYMPIPKSASKKNRALMLSGDIRPGKRPDRTNIAKLVEDALNGIVFKDDSLIVGGCIEKWYCEFPRVEITVMKV